MRPSHAGKRPVFFNRIATSLVFVFDNRLLGRKNVFFSHIHLALNTFTEIIPPLLTHCIKVINAWLISMVKKLALET